jgi:hypothetical protein
MSHAEIKIKNPSKKNLRRIALVSEWNPYCSPFLYSFCRQMLLPRDFSTRKICLSDCLAVHKAPYRDRLNARERNDH